MKKQKNGKADIIVLIVLSILILVALVFLIYQNMSKTASVNSNTSDTNTISQSENAVNEEKIEKVETPKEIDVNSEVSKKMMEIIELPGYPDWSYVQVKDVEFSYYYFLGYGNKITKDTFTNEQKQNIAYWYAYRNKLPHGKNYSGGSFDTVKGKNNMVQEITKSQTEQYMKEIFGEVSFIPSDFKFCNKDYIYDEETEAYYIDVANMGIGGGPLMPHAKLKVSKIEEYSEKYVAYIKGVYIDYESSTEGDGKYNIICCLKDGSKKVYKENVLPVDDDFERQNALEQNIDKAYTFKVIFNKSGDSFYWVSTERE